MAMAAERDLETRNSSLTVAVRKTLEPKKTEDGCSVV